MTGKEIEHRLQFTRKELSDITKALEILCKERKCMVDKSSDGDTTAIILLRKQKESFIDNIKTLEDTDYSCVITFDN